MSSSKGRLVEGRRRLCTMAPAVEESDRPGDEDGDLDAIIGQKRRLVQSAQRLRAPTTADCPFDAVPSLFHLRRIIDGVEYKAVLLPSVRGFVVFGQY